jgi:hypothetical protein
MGRELREVFEIVRGVLDAMAEAEGNDAGND